MVAAGGSGGNKKLSEALIAAANQMESLTPQLVHAGRIRMNYPENKVPIKNIKLKKSLNIFFRLRTSTLRTCALSMLTLCFGHEDCATRRPTAPSSSGCLRSRCRSTQFCARRPSATGSRRRWSTTRRWRRASPTGCWPSPNRSRTTPRTPSSSTGSTGPQTMFRIVWYFTHWLFFLTRSLVAGVAPLVMSAKSVAINPDDPSSVSKWRDSNKAVCLTTLRFLPHKLTLVLDFYLWFANCQLQNSNFYFLTKETDNFFCQ